MNTPVKTFVAGGHATTKSDPQDFTQSRSFRMGLEPNGRSVVLDLRVISTMVQSLSAGAVLTVQEINPRAKTKTAAALTKGNLTFTAVAGGLGGNAITVAAVNPGTDDAALSVGVVGNAITINLATGHTGLVTSTEVQVKAALLASAPAMALISVALSGAGAGLVTAWAAAPLAGGLDWVVVQTLVNGAALSASAVTGSVETISVVEAKVVTGVLLLTVTGSTAAVDKKEITVAFLTL